MKWSHFADTIFNPNQPREISTVFNKLYVHSVALLAVELAVAAVFGSAVAISGDLAFFASDRSAGRSQNLTFAIRTAAAARILKIFQFFFAVQRLRSNQIARKLSGFFELFERLRRASKDCAPIRSRENCSEFPTALSPTPTALPAAPPSSRCPHTTR